MHGMRFLVEGVTEYALSNVVWRTMTLSVRTESSRLSAANKIYQNMLLTFFNDTSLINFAHRIVNAGCHCLCRGRHNAVTILVLACLSICQHKHLMAPPATQFSRRHPVKPAQCPSPASHQSQYDPSSLLASPTRVKWTIPNVFDSKSNTRKQQRHLEAWTEIVAV